MAEFVEWAKRRAHARVSAEIEDIAFRLAWNGTEFGLAIYADFSIDNHREREGEVTCWVHYDDEDAWYEHFRLFLPASTLVEALPGEGQFDLMFDLQVLDGDGEVLAESDWVLFDFALLEFSE